MSGKRPFRALVWTQTLGAGGLGDQVKGMMTTLLAAIATDRAFFLQDASNFEAVFEPAGWIEWRWSLRQGGGWWSMDERVVAIDSNRLDVERIRGTTSVIGVTTNTEVVGLLEEASLFRTLFSCLFRPRGTTSDRADKILEKLPLRGGTRATTTADDYGGSTEATVADIKAGARVLLQKHLQPCVHIRAARYLGSPDGGSEGVARQETAFFQRPLEWFRRRTSAMHQLRDLVRGPMGMVSPLVEDYKELWVFSDSPAVVPLMREMMKEENIVDVSQLLNARLHSDAQRRLRREQLDNDQILALWTELLLLGSACSSVVVSGRSGFNSLARALVGGIA